MSEEENKKHTNSEELNNLEVYNNPAKEFLSFAVDLIKTGIIVFILAFVLRYFVIQPFVVDGESMMPNYINEEYLLAEKVSYLTKEPKRGDVIVFRYPGNPNVNYIKRVIGLPGETVQVADNQVKISNSANPSGIILAESYLPSSVKTLTNDGGSISETLAMDEYFVMGDNRQHSSDSREWGPLKKSNILGRAWLTIMPLDHFELHRRVTYSKDLSLSFNFPLAFS